VTASIPDLPPAPRTAVHRRSIIMDSYEVDDEHVTVVGRLTDVQPWGGPGRPGSTAHGSAPEAPR
jgi:hypothetical protein